MTDTKQTEALRLANCLQDHVVTYPQLSEDEPGGYCGEVDRVMDESAAELRRLHAENTTLQQGYDAARLEIEVLQARIKAMAEERADELAVAHLDGRMRAGQPAPVMFDGLTEEETMNTASYAGLTTKLAGEYPPLPASYVGGTLLSAEPGITGCKVVLRFSNTDEAEVWFGALATRSAAPVAQGDAEDAARYRWLRARWGRIADEYDGDSDQLVAIRESDSHFEGWDVDPVTLDRAIDAARTQTKEGQSHE